MQENAYFAGLMVGRFQLINSGNGLIEFPKALVKKYLNQQPPFYSASFIATEEKEETIIEGNLETGE